MFERAPDVTEPIEGISVLQAADAEAEGGVIQITDRSQVLDGLVRHGDDLLIVIETKLEGRVSSRQAQYLNVHGAQVHFNGPVKAVDWRELLAIWSALVETNVVAGAERSLIEDFLIYVERHFPRLGPFRTLSQCRENASRITMRLNAVLDEMAEGLSSTWLELPGRSAVDRAFLEFDVTPSAFVLLSTQPTPSPKRRRSIFVPAPCRASCRLLAPVGASNRTSTLGIWQRALYGRRPKHLSTSTRLTGKRISVARAQFRATSGSNSGALSLNSSSPGRMIRRNSI
jgi:hypothetical protein